MMNKTLWMFILLGCALATQVARAEPGHRHVKPVKASGKTSQLQVRSHIALILDEQSQLPLFNKNAETVAPIASITKLMTAMVALDAMQPMDEEVSVEPNDPGARKKSRSRLSTGMSFARSELLKMALIASENRAALALARSYPGGAVAMVAAMNAKAQELGMQNTRFYDPTGLNRDNVSTAQDLAKMVAAAQNYTLIHQYSTTATLSVDSVNGRAMRFSNTNPLVRNASWDIGVSKTGYISEAGLCLVMAAKINQRPVIIVLLNSWGKRTRVGDANRVRKWLENTYKREHRA